VLNESSPYCFTESGRVFTFGTNDWGQLGLGTTTTADRPSCIKCNYDNTTHIMIGFEKIIPKFIGIIVVNFIILQNI